MHFGPERNDNKIQISNCRNSISKHTESRELPKLSFNSQLLVTHILPKGFTLDGACLDVSYCEQEVLQEIHDERGMLTRLYLPQNDVNCIYIDEDGNCLRGRHGAAAKLQSILLAAEPASPDAQKELVARQAATLIALGSEAEDSQSIAMGIYLYMKLALGKDRFSGSEIDDYLAQSTTFGTETALFQRARDRLIKGDFDTTCRRIAFVNCSACDKDIVTGRIDESGKYAVRVSDFKMRVRVEKHLVDVICPYCDHVTEAINVEFLGAIMPENSGFRYFIQRSDDTG